MDLTLEGVLGSTIGIAFAVAIIIQLAKPAISKIGERWRDIAVNGIGAVVGILLSFGAVYLLGTPGNRAFIWAIIQGLIAAAVAVYGYEVVKNIGGGVGYKEDEVVEEVDPA